MMHLQRSFVLITSLWAFLQLMISQSLDYPTADLSTTWINSVSAPNSLSYTDGSKVRPILLRGNSGISFACGFFCNGICDRYTFSVFIVQTDNASRIILPDLGFPQVVWSANRKHPVQLNATLQLTSGGDLVLKDVDGTLVWSTGTSGRSVAGLNMTETGNLLLFDTKNSRVWESFGHPTDTLVLGQGLGYGDYLRACVSTTDCSEPGQYFVTVRNYSLLGYVEADSPEIYFKIPIPGTKVKGEPGYIKFQNGSIALHIHYSEGHGPDAMIQVTTATSSGMYLKLEHDGHLRVYDWESKWDSRTDVLEHDLGKCDYPLACGRNSICSNGNCSCPKFSNTSISYFKLVDPLHPELGCSEIIPRDCNQVQSHILIDLEGVSYFSFTTNISDTDINSCKEACLGNCSCQAAIFRYGANYSRGDCYLPSHLLTMNSDKAKAHYNSTIFVKVQTSSSSPPTRSTSHNGPRKLIIVISAIGGSLVFVLFVGFIVFLRWRVKFTAEVEEDYLDFVPGVPIRFSFEDLEKATCNFSKKLGEGAYGCVFEGCLENGIKIAVKRLDGLGRIKKSFLAEVETIGNTHHANLLKLIGFCAENSHRLLVYEHLINGSLEKWIYRGRTEFALNWELRRKIILGIAKGLAYLHEDCRQKVLHLDIKPQNILLDEGFNAKLADFGLSKIIDKDQSQVMTTLKGTPGYLAPEWLYSVVTEKVDVYSFGVVLLEIVCGRRIVEESEPMERRHLLTLFKGKAAEGLFLDMIDREDKEMSCNEAEIEKLLRIAGWCLQKDYTNRPSMSVVVKVLEGLLDVQGDIDYTFSSSEVSVQYLWPQIQSEHVTHLSSAVLSGPR